MVAIVVVVIVVCFFINVAADDVDGDVVVVVDILVCSVVITADDVFVDGDVVVVVGVVNDIDFFGVVFPFGSITLLPKVAWLICLSVNLAVDKSTFSK